ncbi:MAG: HypC/HybG/HupF family hydrogenase formation chaperone [Candidatus Asgardarchaeia archaeon]
MCLAVPAKILSIRGAKALVDFGGIRREVNIALLESPKEGDYVLVHAGFAIQKIDEREAKETIKIMKEFEILDEKMV